MKSYKGRGIVLHTLKYGDSSMVAFLLTDVGGRRSYMVQGVRSHSGRGSKLALFQPMFPLEFEGLSSPRQQMDRFREVRAGFPLQSVPFDVRKSTMALFMAEVLYRLVRESEPNAALFDFAWNSTAALDALDTGVANFHLWFLSQLSCLLGFRRLGLLSGQGILFHDFRHVRFSSFDGSSSTVLIMLVQLRSQSNNKPVTNFRTLMRRTSLIS